jgi:hypothetical protein
VTVNFENISVITKAFSQMLHPLVPEMLHQQTGHQGIERTTNLIRFRFYLAGMFHDIDEYCKQCQR